MEKTKLTELRRGGHANEIKMAKSIDDEHEPRTFSYNTKVFNKEIIALRKEEEALLVV